MRNRRWFVVTLASACAIIVIFGTVHAQGDAARGKQLFLQNCAVCHGEDAGGRVGPTLKKDFPGIRVDLFLKQTISGGVAGSVMPAWSKDKGGPLTEGQIDDIVAYIRSLGRPTPPINVTPPPTDTPPSLPAPIATFPAGDASRGARTYAQNCMMCHGDSGQGNVGAALRKDWPGINPDAFIEATAARGVAGTKMPAWAVWNGGPLTAQDIADVTAHIRTLKPGRQPTSAAPSIPTGGQFGGPLALVCTGLVIFVGVAVLGISLAGRKRRTR